MIDPQLEKIGWSLRDQTKVGIEIPVDGYDAEPWNGVSDYTLLRENGDILAIVKTEKIITNVDLAEQNRFAAILARYERLPVPRIFAGLAQMSTKGMMSEVKRNPGIERRGRWGKVGQNTISL